jgi:hypothetical protein
MVVKKLITNNLHYRKKNSKLNISTHKITKLGILNNNWYFLILELDMIPPSSSKYSFNARDSWKQWIVPPPKKLLDAAMWLKLPKDRRAGHY